MVDSRWEIRNKTCIVGIGESRYGKAGSVTDVSEFQLALECIIKACEDAGLDPTELDGFSSYSNDRNLGSWLAHSLGIKQLRYGGMVWEGGGGGYAASVSNAAMAVASGMANYVVCFRSLCQGQFGRFGQSRASGNVTGLGSVGEFQVPFGQMVPVTNYGMRGSRYMHEYGVTGRDLANISVACYKHAQRNPRAVMYGRPLTIEDHQNSRMIADPLRLFDCCQENDGAACVIVTTADRARDLKQKRVFITAGAQGSGHRSGSHMSRPDYVSASFEMVAQDLYARAGIGPKDIQVAQVYENFTPMTMMSIEEHGFCKRGEGKDFVANGNIEWPNGGLPIYTSGGNLAEAYIHGFELVNEGVRQMRGTSTCQVEGAKYNLCAGGPGTEYVSDLILMAD